MTVWKPTMGLFLYSVLALFQQPPFITGHSPSTISSFTAVSSSAHQHHRVLQQNNNNNNNEFSNPRAPARRTPDDQAEAGSLSREELQTLLLGSHNIQATDRESSDSNDDEERHRFLLTIIIPTVAFVLCAAYLLQRRRRRLPQRQSPDHEETDGLVHALEEDAFSTKEDLPYRDDDSAPSHAYAEIRRNVI